MKTFIAMTLASASLLCAAPAFAAEPLNLADLDAVTAGNSSYAPTASIKIRNRFDSKVTLEYKNKVDLKGSDYKAAAKGYAYSDVPAYTSATSFADGSTVVDTYNKEWSSFAVAESAGAIQVLRRRGH